MEIKYNTIKKREKAYVPELKNLIFNSIPLAKTIENNKQKKISFKENIQLASIPSKVLMYSNYDLQKRILILVNKWGLRRVFYSKKNENYLMHFQI